MNRRAFLFEYGSLMLVASGLAWTGCGRSDPKSSSLDTVVRSRQHILHASRVGEEWIRNSDSAVSAESLVAELLAGIDPEVGVNALRSELLRKHRSDFQSGGTVEVQGWILSRTEVALYALVSLSAQ